MNDAVETFTPLYHKIFTKVNNAKDKPKKIAVLRKYDTEHLRALLNCAFNPDIEWMLPEGEVPYIENDAPDGTDHSRLSTEGRLLYNFVKKKIPNSVDYLVGNPQITDARREMMFIQLLEGLSAGEAQVLCLAKENTLHRKYKGLTATCVREAYGWDENFLDPVEVAKANANPQQRPVQDLGRMPGDEAMYSRG